MKRIILFFSTSLILWFILSSCGQVFGERVRGNGNIQSETRQVDEFSGVDISGAIDLYVKQDSVRSVKIEADENLMGYIEVINIGNKLVVRPEKGYNLKPSRSIKVWVSSPTFRRFEASGACDIISENKISADGELYIDMSGSCHVEMEINAPKIYADLSGSCNLDLKGETKEFEIDGSGSTDVRSMELMAENVKVGISGSGSAEVFASIKLDVSVSGSGDVRYKGNATVNQRISGSGSVKKVE